MARRTIASPLGGLTLREDAGAITGLSWSPAGVEHDDDTPLLREAEAQLARYFEDPATRIELPLRIGGSDFLQRLCAQLCTIPGGETRTYGALARALGVSPQAIGQGVGANPVPIIVPCHRVVGADGLGGYSGQGGVETKVWLLRHEGAGGLLI